MATMACFVCTPTTAAIAKPTLFTQNLNVKSNHPLQLPPSSIHLRCPILPLRKPLVLRRPRLPSQALAVRCTSSSITPPFSLSNHLLDSAKTIFALTQATVHRFAATAAAAVAALNTRTSGYLNAPLRAVVSGMGKWIEIYSGVLMVRVLLSWFPNIPWETQPFSAIRDLCDPYLSLFRNIIPPIFGNLDVSPIFAFTVLGVIASILKGTPGMR